jgi:hypothetical protein
VAKLERAPRRQGLLSYRCESLPIMVLLGRVAAFWYLAVEVSAGEPRTGYLIRTGLRVEGQMLASVPVGRAAPNDIAGTAGEGARIGAARRQYGAAVWQAFARHALLTAHPGAVVIRHWPQRDADNTWHTWAHRDMWSRSRRPRPLGSRSASRRMAANSCRERGGHKYQHPGALRTVDVMPRQPLEKAPADSERTATAPVRPCAAYISPSSGSLLQRG